MRELPRNFIYYLTRKLSAVRAKTTHLALAAHVAISNHFHRNETKIIIGATLLVVAASICVVPFLSQFTSAFFSDANRFSGLKELLLAIGSALIGATAIVFSLILFAMQINIERMPHGLFRRLSSDKRLLFAFILSFFLALAIAIASLMPSEEWVAVVIVPAFWSVIAILGLFLFSYARALALISPTEQLFILVKSANKDLNKVSRSAVLASSKSAQKDSDEETEFDAGKAAYFAANVGWETSARKAIEYSKSYATRFAENGDHDISTAAIESMVLINASYCAAKENTFFGVNPLFGFGNINTDGFINLTLESLRQILREALSKGDERLAEVTLQGIKRLLGVYLAINYSGRTNEKPHAALAAGYLYGGVESVIPHQMPDVMMEGIRLMGNAARTILHASHPSGIVTLVDKIAIFSYVGVLKLDHRPVVLVAMEQLANISFDLMRERSGDIKYAVEQMRTAITEASKRFLEVQDTIFSSVHSSNLSPYFSSTSTTSFLALFVQLVNAVLSAPPADKQAEIVVKNIETWADGLYSPKKELLLLSVQKRSGFTFDILHWIKMVAESLLALSNASACSDGTRKELRKHAVWLIFTLSWIPDDEESIKFTENYSVTEMIFDSALAGRKHECVDYFQEVKKLLLSWAMKGGRYETGWGILEQAIMGLAALALLEGNVQSEASLKLQLSTALAKENAPQEAVRVRAARELRDYRIDTLSMSKIGAVLAQQDSVRTRDFLLELAEILSPT